MYFSRAHLRVRVHLCTNASKAKHVLHMQKKIKKGNSHSHFKRTEQIENKFGRNEEKNLVDALDQTDGQTELQKLLNRAGRQKKKREKNILKKMEK
jgi:hypothetical protein